MSNQLNAQGENIYKESNMIDYIAVILRRKVSVIVVFIIVFVVGVVLASLFKAEDVFNYNTVIKGSQFNVGDLPGIQEIIIPTVLKEFEAATQRRYKIQPSAINGNILVLKSQGTLAATDDILKIHQRLTDLLMEDYKKKDENAKTILRFELIKMENNKNRAESELVAIKEQEKFFPLQQKHIEMAIELAKKQISETKDFIAAAQYNRSIILTSEAKRLPENESLAMTLLLIDNEIQRHQTRLADLEQMVNIDLLKEKEDIEKGILSNKNDQLNAQIKIGEIQQTIYEAQLKVDNFEEIRLVFPPTRQLEPVKRMSRLEIVIIMAIAGLMSGIFWAFLAELVKKARQLRLS